MFQRFVVSSFAVLALVSTGAQAAPSSTPRLPDKLTPAIAQSYMGAMRHKTMNHLSAATKGLIAAGECNKPGRLRSFPTWNGSFTYQGTTYPYTMVGNDPRHGGEVDVDTSYIVLSFLFDEFVDDQGNPLFIDGSPIVHDVSNSPNFVATPYTDGFAQFSDALQRASFYNVMRRDWHTSIEKPRLLTPVVIEVPVGQASVFEFAPGRFVGFVNFDFLYSQIKTILQLEDIRTDELPMLVSYNVSADVALGFHDAYDVTANNQQGIQTYLYTSWLDLDAFGPIYADATTITHEISEWMADPFVNNLTPNYLIPDSGGFCQNYLEVGDPIEFLPNQMAPIYVHGKLYHTQVETTVQWFSREVPSSAFQGTYSYPDTTVLTAPSDPCPTP